MKQFKLEIISPNEIVFEKEIDLVILPGSEGDLGILKDHMPFLTSVRVGIVYIYLEKKLIETWCLSIAVFFSGYLSFYFIKMLIISYQFQERSEGADEILIWIPQTSVAIGSTIFFISVFHQFILIIKKLND